MTTATTATTAGWVPYVGPVTKESLRQFIRSMMRTKTERGRTRYVHGAVNAVTAAGVEGTLTDGRIIVKLSPDGRGVASELSLLIRCEWAGGKTSDNWGRHVRAWWADNARVKADLLGGPLWQMTDPGDDGKTWYYLPPKAGSGGFRYAVVEARYYDLMKRLHPDAEPWLESCRDQRIRPVHFKARSGEMVGAIMPIEREGPKPAA